MNFLVVAAAWPPERQPDRLVEALVDAGDTVTVAADRSRTGRWAKVGAEVVPLARANEASPAALRRLLPGGARAVASPAETVRISRGLLHMGSGRALAEGWFRLMPLAGRHWDRVLLPAEPDATAWLPLARVAGRLVVVAERLPAPTPGGGQSGNGRKGAADALREILSAAAEVHAASPALSDRALALGASAARTRVVRPTVDTGRFAPRPPSDTDTDADPEAGAGPPPPTPHRPLRVAASAPFSWQGGHDYLLVAAQRAIAGGLDLHLHLVGGGADRQRLLYTIADLGLEPNVTVHPAVDRDARRALLAAADAVVVPAVEDRPWPELLEAMAAGLTVVASDLPAVREMVTDGVEGWLVPGRDAAALADALARLAADAAARSTAGDAGRTRALRWAEAHARPAGAAR